MPDHVLTLEDNATDSFVTGVKMYLEPYNLLGWKYALLLVGQSLELFLKARLAKANPTLIFFDPKKAHDPNAKTVGYEEAIERLTTLGLSFTTQDLADIRFVRDLRNRVEHNEIRVDQLIVDTYLSRAMRFLDGFIYDELGLNVIDLFESAAQFQEFKEHTKSTEEQIAEAEQRANDQLPIRPKDRYSWEVVTCPECDAQAVPVNERMGPVRCERCKAEWEVEECRRCAGIALVTREDEYPYYCDTCTWFH